MLEALFSAAAEAVFSYILDTLEPAERLRDWLKRNPAKLAYQHALARTYTAFARQYPELTASLFNESFLTIEAAPELAKFLTRHEYPDHTQLVRLWAKSITPQTEAGQQSVEVLSKRENLNAASSYFVELLTSELKRESALQPLFDSRALESLPAIEAKLDQLMNALTQAMTIANNYEQTVVNRSGGVDFQAQDVTIGGDVVGRDKIVSNVYNSYFGGDFATLDDLYVRPDAVFQRVRVQDFVGREWLTAKVDAFLNDEKRKSGVFLLVGEAGVGKTSFMAHLVTERRYLHLFAEQVPGDVNVSRAMQSLGAQLVARYQIDPYKEKGTLPAIATFPDFLDKLLRLAADKLSAGEKIVIVCDALDEAGTAPNGNVFGLPSVLPDGVYFILSQRPVATVKLSVKADLVRETIEAAGADNLQDVEQYLTAVSRRPEISIQLRAHHYTEVDFVRILKERSGGVWMYLFYVVSEIAAGSRAPLDLATLPSGLAGYYTDYWGDWSEGRNERGDGPTKWNAVYAPLLATLAAAQSPISLKLLLAWSKVQATEYVVERLLRRNWRAFITEREIDHTPHFALYHASLRDFLTGQVDRQGLTLEAEQLTNELSRRARDAHACIVEYYHQQCNSDWVKLIDDDYARTHLCLHLSASGDDEAMFQLVAMSNAWAEAKYTKEESYGGYLVDLNWAWQYVETELHWNISRQIRCALIESSIHSLAGNISARLLRNLVQAHLWSPIRALAHIPQIPDESSRANSLSQIARLLPNDLKTEALAMVCALETENYRAQALAVITPALPETLQARALAVVCALESEEYRAQALAVLAPTLPEILQTEALAAARAIHSAWLRAQVLAVLALTLSEELRTEVLSEALAAARAIKTEMERLEILSAIAQTLPVASQKEVLSEALGIWPTTQNEMEWVQILSTLVPVLPKDLHMEVFIKALAIVHTFQDDRARAQALAVLMPTLPAALQPEALAMVHALKTKGEWEQALETTRALQSEISRKAALYPRLPLLHEHFFMPTLSEPINVKVLNESLATARAFEPQLVWEEVVSEFTSTQHETLQVEDLTAQLAAARAIKDERERVEVLLVLAPVLPDALQIEALIEALNVARTIKDVREQVEVLSTLIPMLPEPSQTEALTEALSMTHTIKNQRERVEVLSVLAPILPEPSQTEALTEVLAATYGIWDEWDRARLLSRLASIFPDALQAQAIAAARAIRALGARARVLSALAPAMSESMQVEVLTEALATARATQLERVRAEALSALASTYPQILSEALAAARAIRDEEDRTHVLSQLVPILPNTLQSEVVSEVLVTARTVQNKQARVRRLSTFAPILPDALQSEVLKEILAAAYSIQEDAIRAQVLSSLVSILPPSAQLDVLADVIFLICNLPYFTSSGRSERFEIYCQIIPTWSKSQFSGFQGALLWTETLHELAQRSRGELLDDLAVLLPLVEHLGGQAAIEEFFYAIRDVTTWWP
jgi:hypothetical protein